MLFAMITITYVRFYLFASFYSIAKITTLLIVRETCQKCHYLILKILFVQYRSRRELFFDAPEQWKSEIGEITWMRESLASLSSHFINGCASSVQGELSKCKALAASTAPSRSEMELIQ
jgi:hypothetical protein